ncbi:MAG: RNA polymerase sporulation sigma factor SigK [Clostridiales bacterium]|nr:RNA polymerase sporulation sigma factor SigK [Clostridiales bacterium]MDY2834703.1 RNA polymerase sporulation sigma factor SigK [Candidatus Aphodomonas sp.]
MLAWLFTSLIRDALFFLGYLNDRSSFPKPLSAREERACLRRMQEGDDSARRALIEHNLRLVAHIARKYTVPGCDADDLVSIGAIGLIKAVNTFRPDSGTTLSTYASRCIENEILMCLRSSHKRRNDVSLEEPVGSDSEGNEITLMEMLGTDPDAVTDEVDRRITLSRIRTLIRQKLPERERIVLEMRYGLLDGECRPQYEVAEALGISRSYVSRIEKKAVQTLESALRGKSRL